ncbi:MAG: tetratricopeptide repeat protein [Chloroflexota bacterium]
MAGNQRQYERAIKRAAEHVERQEWSRAIEQYELALAEYADDADALTGLGLAYLNSQQLEKALACYEQARQAGVEDLTTLERLADIQERLGRLDKAADTYVALAQNVLQNRDIDRAVHYWKRAAQLAPGHAIAHLKLAQAYASQGHTRGAVKEYLTLARAFERRRQPDQAMNICQQALMLDPSNTDVLSYMSSLRELLPAKEAAPASRPVAVDDWQVVSFEDEPTPSQREEGSPVDMARQRALSALAEAVFEGDLAQDIAPPRTTDLTKQQIDTLTTQSLDYQRQGLVDEALWTYEQLLNAGIERPEVFFNLGLLYQEKLRWDDAIRCLSQVWEHSDYKLGALFAVGECYRAQGKMDQALNYLLEVLKLVDLATVDREQADDLIQLYESLADTYAKKGDPAQARRFTDSLVQFLSSKGWEDKVKEARERLDGVAGEGVVMSLAEIVGVPGSEAILRSMTMIQELVKRARMAAAVEEAYEAIRVSPFYLPLHMRLGDVFLSQGYYEAATEKYLTVAHLYQVRGDTRAAIGVYRRLLKVSPMDVTVRSRLINLLVSRGNIDGALSEYLALGEAYFQLAQIDKSLSKYNEALRLAPRGSDEKAWTVKILHRIGDIHMQRVDWRQAFDVYQRVKQISPDDERACLSLVDLHYKMGNAQYAVRELDGLVGRFFREQKLQKAMAILRDAVQMRPAEEPLRLRLAEAYLATGRKEEAVNELDALGDLQLKAGRAEQAIETIRRIVQINPANVESYRQLLRQIGGA